MSDTDNILTIAGVNYRIPDRYQRIQRQTPDGAWVDDLRFPIVDSVIAWQLVQRAIKVPVVSSQS